MRQKLFKKQFGAIALIVFLSLSSILMILTFMYNNYLAEEKYKILQKSCESICDFIELETQEQNKYSYYSIYYIVNNLANVSECDIFVTDLNGVVKICGCEEWKTENDCQHSGTQISIDAINSVISEDRNTISTLGFYSSPHYTEAKEIRVGGVKSGYVVATDSIDEAKNLMHRAYIRSFGNSAAGVNVCGHIYNDVSPYKTASSYVGCCKGNGKGRFFTTYSCDER